MSDRDKKYNQKRKMVLKVETLKEDEEAILFWETLKADLTKKSGNTKLGIIELYEKAKKEGYFD
jgi:hypothetical protein